MIDGRSSTLDRYDIKSLVVVCCYFQSMYLVIL